MNNEDITTAMRELAGLEALAADPYGEYSTRARHAADRLKPLIPFDVPAAKSAPDPMEAAGRLDALWRSLAARHEWSDAQRVNKALADLTEVGR
jgi:hypothetical protein